MFLFFKYGLSLMPPARVSEKVSFKIFTDFWCVCFLKKHINQIATLFSLHGRRREGRRKNLSQKSEHTNPSAKSRVGSLAFSPHHLLHFLITSFLINRKSWQRPFGKSATKHTGKHHRNEEKNR